MIPLLDKSHYPLLLVAVPIFFGLRRLFQCPIRPSKVPHLSERVLVLGATSGIGRAIALQYAERGARVCMVGRRQVKLDEVMSECGDRCLAVRGDFSNVEDMVRVRNAMEECG
jgi:NADPH:quinone reductase-like Zn-dependent oxidoreductase